MALFPLPPRPPPKRWDVEMREQALAYQPPSEQSRLEAEELAALREFTAARAFAGNNLGGCPERCSAGRRHMALWLHQRWHLAPPLAWPVHQGLVHCQPPLRRPPLLRLQTRPTRKPRLTGAGRKWPRSWSC